MSTSWIGDLDVKIMVIAILLLAACCAYAAKNGENSCPNPGFELLNPAGDNFPLNWSTEKDPAGKAGAVVDKDAHGGAIAVRLFASAEGTAWLNSDPLPARRGTLKFYYKAVKSDANGANLNVYAIGMNSAGREVNRIGMSVPAEQVGDGQWHEGSVEFVFEAGVAGIVIGARINEGTSKRAAGEMLVDDFELVEVKIGPKPLVEALFMPQPVMLVGKPADLVAQITNTGDEPVPASKLRLTLPPSVKPASGSVEVDVETLPPLDSKRFTWQIVGSKRDEFDIGVEWAGAARTRHGVCVKDLKPRELCTRADGYWTFMPKPVPLQEGGAEMTPLKTLRSADLPDSMIGITAHIPRSRDFETIFEPEHLIDGNYETSWSGRAHETAMPGATDWAQVDLARPADIAELRLVPYWNAQGFPVDFDIKLRSGGAWQTALHYRRVIVDLKDGQQTKKPFAIKLPTPIKADAIRIETTRFGSPASFFTDCASTYYMRLSEIEALDASGRNVALASAGAKASASSTFRSFYNSVQVVRDTYPELYNIGVKWNRIGQWGDWTCWTAVERKKGEYTIDPTTDAAITDSVKNGVNILFTLDYGNPLYEQTPWLTDLGPVWRHGHPFTGDGGPTKPESIQAFVNYARFCATHFKGRVKVYEIWNEENSWAWYGSPPDPKAYGTLLRETAKALKEVDPEIKVMVGGTAALAPTFISQALDEGAGPYLDAIAFHPYTMPYPEMGLGALDVVDGKQMGRDKKEFGYTTYREMLDFHRKTFAKYNPNFEYWADEWNAIPTREDSAYHGCSEIQEAKHAARFFAMSTLTGVRGVWWSLANQNTVYDWGVLRTEDLSRKPAYYAMQAMCTLLSGARPDPPDPSRYHTWRDRGVKATAKGDVPELQCEVLAGRDGETLIAIWCATPPADDFSARRISLKIDRGDAKSADAVDTFHGLVQKLNFKTEGSSIMIEGLLAPDYPVIVRVR